MRERTRVSWSCGTAVLIRHVGAQAQPSLGRGGLQRADTCTECQRGCIGPHLRIELACGVFGEWIGTSVAVGSHWKLAIMFTRGINVGAPTPRISSALFVEGISVTALLESARTRARPNTCERMSAGVTVNVGAQINAHGCA